MFDKTISHFEIEERIGRGGMGDIFAARDLRLDRRVALKRIRQDLLDETMRRRLWREARAAAAVSHPHVCQIFEVVEVDGELLISMELLHGSSLQDRMASGPIPVADAREISLEILGALEAVHACGIVHRDLKPANIFMTAHGVKLLDFGLSRGAPTGETRADLVITQPGRAVGTPRYMAPEQWVGEAIGPAADLFALGAVMYEMLSGLPALKGSTLREMAEAALRGETPALPEGEGFAPLNRILGKAMARNVADRYSEAGRMAADIRKSGDSGAEVDRAVSSPSYTRLVVLPFRILRTDPETDFLAFSLPDAIVTSLSRLESIVVCSSAGLPLLEGGVPDIRAISDHSSADAVLYGNVMRAGNRVRVATQLIRAPSGDVLWAHTSQATLDDIFQVQDQLAHEVVNSLAVDLTAGDRQALEMNKPASGRAYELYLRANQLAGSISRLNDAGDLYRSCIDLDPSFAPAWARLGRIYRIQAKYSRSGNASENLRRAEEAFQKALGLDSELSIAHNLFTFHELEELGRSREAMVRLLDQVKRRRNDPNLYSGLVTACRFCGLLDASVSAHLRARRLDPGIPTSVHYTHLLRLDWEGAIADDDEDMKFAGNHALAMAGRESEARAGYCELERGGLEGLERYVTACSRSALDENREECVAAYRELKDSTFRDPEGLFLVARNLTHVGEIELALPLFEDVVQRGFHVPFTLENDPWLEILKGNERFGAVQALAARGAREAEASFMEMDGPRLLGEITKTG